MAYLLDTSALSEPVRKKPNPGYISRLSASPPNELFTSSVCFMELAYGCALKDDARLWEQIEGRVLSQIQVIAFGEEEARRCAQVLAVLTKAGTPIGIEDAQIAATALVHGLTVVTGNVRHFGHVSGLNVETWLKQ